MAMVIENQEEKLGKFVSVEADSLIVCTNEGVVVETNTGFLDKFGYQLAELDNKKFIDMVHPNERMVAEKKLTELSVGKQESLMLGFYSKNGELTQTRWRFIKQEDGLIYARIGAVQEENRMFHQKFQQIEDVLLAQAEYLLRWKLDSTVVYVNEKASEIFGFEYRSVIGKKVSEFAPELYQLYMRDRAIELPKILTEENKSSIREIKVVGLDGKVRWQEWIDVAVFLDGKIIQIQSTGRDITERKLVEIQVWEQEQRLDLATKAGGIGVWDWDMSQNKLVWDKQMFSIFGISEKDFSGTFSDYSKVVYIEDLERVTKEIEEAVKGRKPFDTQFRIHKHQEERVIRALAQILITDGQPTRMVGVNWDVTEDELIKTKLRESEYLFRTAFNSATAGIALVSHEGLFIKINQTLAELLGYGVEELTGKNCIDLTYESDRKKTEELWQKLILGEEKKMRYVKRYVHKNGHIVWVDVELVRVESADGTFKHFLKQVKDISKEKETLSQLERFKLAIEQSTDGVIFTNVRGEIEYVNKYWEEMTGYKFDEVVGKNPRLLQSGQTPKKIYEEMWKKLSSGEVFVSDEIVNRRKNGEIYFAQLSVYPISEGGQISYYVGLEQDITKRKDIDRMKTEFISLASHQLRTPLTSMKWNLEMMLDGDVGELQAQQKDMAQVVYQANERLVHLVNDLLDVSRIESGRLVLEPSLTDFKKLVEGVVAELEPLLKEKKHTCVVSINEHLGEVMVDAKMIRNVFLNIISNSIKYTKEGGLIEIYVSKNDEGLLCQISDNGMGIPKKEFNRVFEKFYRGENVLKTVVEGTGLGMYLVKAVIESSGGKVWFDSEIDKGTTIWFSLPVIENLKK